MLEIDCYRRYPLLRDRPSELVFVYCHINELAFRDFQRLAILLRVNPHLNKNAHRTSDRFPEHHSNS